MTCSAWARELDEPLAGTAPEAVGWLVVELPGPWGHDAACDHRWGPSIPDLVDLPDGVRFQAIRRPDETAPATLQAYLAHGGATPWLRSGQLDDLRDLADLPISSTLRPEPPSWGEAHDESLYLVCTHARRDRCCATFGRPVHDALAAVRSGVWETSHTGGHRFAGNVLVLPHGLLYGGLGPLDAMTVVERHERGEVATEFLRGRSAWPKIAQAAEVALRQRDDLRSIDDLELAGVDGQTVTLVIEGSPTGLAMRAEGLPPHPVSCGADPTTPQAWRLVGG